MIGKVEKLVKFKILEKKMVYPYDAPQQGNLLQTHILETEKEMKHGYPSIDFCY